MLRWKFSIFNRDPDPSPPTQSPFVSPGESGFSSSSAQTSTSQRIAAHIDLRKQLGFAFVFVLCARPWLISQTWTSHKLGCIPQNNCPPSQGSCKKFESGKLDRFPARWSNSCVASKLTQGICSIYGTLTTRYSTWNLFRLPIRKLCQENTKSWLSFWFPKTSFWPETHTIWTVFLVS